MRPSLSDFEYGAYGTPSTSESDVVGGPHDESVGSEATISVNAIGAILRDITPLCSACKSCLFETMLKIEANVTIEVHNFLVARFSGLD